MLDIKYIRDHKDEVIKGIKDKGFDIDIDHVLEIDSKYRELLQKVEILRSERNRLAREKNIEEGKKLKNILTKEENAMSSVKDELTSYLLKIPNPADESVPVGHDESGNQEIAKWGEIPKFSYKVKDHIELGKALDILDLERGTKIGGFRGYFMKNELVILENAVLQYALRYMIEQNFTPLSVPWLVNDKTLYGTGYFPWGLEDHYSTQDGTKLIGTSEVPLTAYHMDEILSEKELPVKLVGISPCFRREVGSYGKDVKGLIRVHQFQKVEQVVLCVSDKDEEIKWHEKMRKYSENILQDLKLPYRVLLMCTGDMGAGQRKKYDIETWFPSQNKYRETHSDSYFDDFQSRRLNIRYRTKKGELIYVYTLNNTVIATPRVLAAILENYQQEDGSVVVPEVLRKYTEFDKIKLKV